MGEKKTHQSGSEGGTIIQVKLTVVIIFSVALVVAAALVAYSLGRQSGRENPKAASLGPANMDILDVEESNSAPSGQLVVRDIELEQPEEYVAYETATNHVETWNFENMTPGQVRDTLQASGVPASQVGRLFASAMLSTNGPNTIVTPDDELAFSLDPPARTKLYNVLAHFNANQFMRFPFCFHTNTFEARFGDGKLKPETLALLKKLMYQRGDTDCFSDLAIMLNRIADDAERLRFVKALSRQSAVLVRVRIWPDTDVDKIINYWSWPGTVRLIDTRPLLESLKRIPGGGSVSILYFLPPFARERLYTYPLPSQPGDPTMDCHWSTMNFFNEIPDDRFSSPRYIAQCLATNFYQIAKPTAYGDIILLTDQKNEAIHSAVYLADDIVFTKNGNNFAQPWMLMRLKDLEAEYTTDVPPRLVIYRNKNR